MREKRQEMIRTENLIVLAIVILLIELVFDYLVISNNFNYYYLFAAVRFFELSTTFGLILYWKFFNLIGLIKVRFLEGIKQGLGWSFALGGVTFSVTLVLHSCGIPFLDLIKVTLPVRFKDLIIFFLLGGVIAPVFEEIIFRGFIYGYLSLKTKYPAIFISSLIFALFHSNINYFPWVQFIGGIIFALAYQKSKKNLFVPVTVHSLGNLAIFSLSLTPLKIG